MAWRESTNRVQAVAERRLAGLARDWLPPASGPAEPIDPAWPVADPLASRRLALGGWGRPALRGLAVLLAVALAVAAYGAWLGRPRAVAVAPAAIATGVALTAGGDGAASASLPAAPPTLPSGPASASVPAPPEVVVHVVGDVRRPGVVRLAIGSRVEDAIAAAGGVTKRRAEDSVNLARVLVDGEQVVVSQQPPPGSTAAPIAPVPPVVDLNAATVEALDGLPGIGPVIASRIIAWRTANGPFRSVDELGEVSGIGEAILAQIRALVRV